MIAIRKGADDDDDDGIDHSMFQNMRIQDNRYGKRERVREEDDKEEKLRM